MKKYYRIVAKCGHVGRNRYIEMAFPVIAEDIHEATAIARNIPRVKHHRKDAISSAVEITYAEYLFLRSQNSMNPYLKCRTKREQGLIIDEIAPFIQEVAGTSHKKQSRKERAIYHMRKQKEYFDSLSSDMKQLVDECFSFALSA